MRGLAVLLVAACLTSCARCVPTEGTCRPSGVPGAAEGQATDVGRVQFAAGRVRPVTRRLPLTPFRRQLTSAANPIQRRGQLSMGFWVRCA